MIHGIPNPAIAILVTVSNLIMEVSINDHKANLAYGSGNKSGVAAGSGPAFLVQHNNKEFDTETNEWVTYTGANRWKPWGKTWIEPGRLFLTTDLEGAIQFLAEQQGTAGGGAGASSTSVCPDCGGNKKHKRIANGAWCPKSKRASKAEKLTAEGGSAF